MTPQSIPVIFSVRRCEPQLIVPARQTLGELKELSDIDDQQGLRFQIPFIMFYPRQPNPNSMKGKDPANLIKEALGKALVYYYPFAGRLIEGPNRKLIVDCTGEGILFIEGDADVTLDQLGDESPHHPNYIEQLLYDVPGSSDIFGCPLLLIQVTRLVCGGFIFAVRLNHPMSDSIGLANFLKAVGEFVRGASEPSLLPVWQRHILDARNPPRVTCVHHEFDELIPSARIMSSGHDTDMVPCSFFFGTRELKSIRKHVPFHLEKCSNFEVLTALLWRSRTIALEADAGDFVRLSCVVNARGAQGLQLPPGYYGNAFAYPAAISKAGLLCEYPLGYALELTRRLKTQMNAEYIRSVADLMVIKGRPHYDTVSNFLVADVTRSGLGDVDFGWGKPIYAGPARAFRNFSIYCRVQNRKGENGTLVPLWLPRPAMERFKQELFKFAQYQAPADTDDWHGVVYPRIITSML